MSTKDWRVVVAEVILEKPPSEQLLKAEWYLYDDLVGKSDIEMVHTHGEKHAPYSVLRYCHECGDVWSRIKVTDKSTRWLPTNRICPECSKLDTVPMGEKNSDMYVLPAELDEREMKSYMELGDEHKYNFFLITGGM